MSVKLAGIEPARALLDRFADSLAQVLESMAERRPEAHWQAISGALPEVCAEVCADPQDEMFWWEQPLQFGPEMKIWVGAPRTTWEQTGTRTLKAAGLETVETGEAKNTWIEILGQSLSAVARAAGAILSREVTCEGGVEHAPDSGIKSGRQLRSLSMKARFRHYSPLSVPRCWKP